MNHPAAPAASAPPALLRNDFSDRLSPILVKELRQGLRQPTFVIAFLCLQVLLAIVVVVSVVSAPVGSHASMRVGQTVSGFFFVLLAIAIMVVQPLRGLGALATEIKADTLDLLLLTRLNSWRITFGKWLALVSQSALLVVAVFPYLILRYYLGGMQLFSELLSLFTLFVASASLTAIAVGFSATASVVIRGLVALAMVMGLWTLPSLLMYVLMRGSMGRSSFFSLTLTTSSDISTFAGVMLLLVFLGYYFLEMGATQISPPAENRSTCKRLSGLAALGGLYALLPSANLMLYSCWLMVVSLLTVDALSERPGFSASVLRPFRRLGPLRQALGMFLLPGWPSGLFYTLLLAAITLVMGSSTRFIPAAQIAPLQAFWPLWFAALLFPAVVVAWCMPKSKNFFGSYIVVLLASLIVALVFFIIGETTRSTDSMILLVPVCPALGLMSYGEYSNIQRLDTLTIIAPLTCAAYWLALLVRSMPHWKRVRAMDQALASQPAAAVAGAATTTVETTDVA